MEFSKATEKELVRAIAKRAGVTQVLAKLVFYSISEIIEEKLKEGKEVRLPYIGTFYFKRKKAMVSNLTHQHIPPHHQLKFRFRPDLPMYVRKMSREF